MQQRDVVAQRILTLSGMLAGPDGPFGATGGAVGRRLVEGWAAERRLLQRLLDETKGDDVLATVAIWHDRTSAFLAKAGADEGAWRDRDGHVWVAADVLRMLDDLVNRIGAWRSATEAGGPARAGAPTAATRQAVRDAELAALREAAGDELDEDEILDDDDESDDADSATGDGDRPVVQSAPPR